MNLLEIVAASVLSALFFLSPTLADELSADALGIVVHTSPGIPYATGGVGKDQRDALFALAKKYNLKLVFALQHHHEFVRGVSVRIFDESGKEVLAANDTGPLFFTTLTAGAYRVEATVRARTQTETAKVVEGRQTQLAFYW
jgi:hypothetical protein